MIKFIYILTISIVLISCGKIDHHIDSPIFETNLNTWIADTSEYSPDTTYFGEGKSRYSVEPIKRLKLSGHFIDKDLLHTEIVQLKIRTVTKNDRCTDSFDINGNIIFEGCNYWYGQRSYRYSYNNKGLATEIYQLDSNNVKVVLAKYKYDSQDRLIQAGPYILEYYDNGLLKSFEDRYEIERYGYDKNGNLNHIFFDIQGGMSVCGNRTSQWRGEYDSEGRLIKDELVAFPNGLVRYFEYSKSGDLIKTKNIVPHTKGTNKRSIDYKYQDKKLVEIYYHPTKDFNEHSETFTYTFYN